MSSIRQPAVTTTTSTEIKSTETPTITYPTKESRYSRLWWNTNSQHCYTETDVLLLKKIIHIYQEIINFKPGLKYFNTEIKTSWHDWWQCTTPAEMDGTDAIDHLHTAETYTLPNRPSADSNIYPLWSYADNQAKAIANWQSERAHGQDVALVNDPVMLVLDEMRNWFYHQLSKKECNTDTLNEISKRQSYLKSIIHTIPDFGMDRYRLHELTRNLNGATDLIKQCIANKELPQLLSDLTISGKNLESTLASYLHFLLINEKVSDNYSPDMIANPNNKCLSPICKIYHSDASSDNGAMANKLLGFSELPKFLKFSNEQVNTGTLHATASLSLTPLKNIHFASFVNNEQKMDYLRAVTTLEALTTIRKTFEKFNSLQTKIGTYLFASHYLDLSNQLAEHYTQLIDSTNRLINKLIQHAESGHSKLLQDSKMRSLNINFESNLRSLETQYAKGTTTSLQLNEFCITTMVNIQKYQHEMKRLVSVLASGEANHEVNQAMNELYQQMNYLNQVIPALLGNPDVRIQLMAPLIEISQVNSCEDTKHHQNDAIPQQTTTSLPTENSQCYIDATDDDPLYLHNLSWQIAYNPQSKSPVFNFYIAQDDSKIHKITIHTNLLDIKTHPNTNLPIYVYGVQDQPTRGTVEFYGLPQLCVTANKKQHNIIKATGIFSDFNLNEMQLEQEKTICVHLPPSFLSTTVSAMGQSILHGTLRGGANAFGATASQHSVYQNIVAQTTYISAAFVTSLTYHTYQQYSNGNTEPTAAFSTAMIAALHDTAPLAIMNFGASLISASLESAGDYLLNHQWNRLGSGFKRASQIARFGFFAYNTAANGDFTTVENTIKTITTTSASIIAGSTAQKLTEEGTRRLLNK